MNGLNSHLYLISNALVGTEQKHRVISQNIANVNTPGYKTQQVDFAKLMDSVSNGDEGQAMIDNVPVEIVKGLEERIDGNNVNIDQQISELNKNALLYQTLTELMASKMSIMRRAISG